MIAAAKMPNLMPEGEVIDAEKDVKFRTWSVRAIDEGIEVLTGARAGDRTGDGALEVGTTHGPANVRLTQMAGTLRFHAGVPTPAPFGVFTD